MDVAHTAVTGSFTIASIYGPLTQAIKHVQETRYEVPEATLGSSYSLSWGSWQGELESTGVTNALAAQGPEEVDELLEQISMAKLNDVRYACCYSCAGGCIGGPCVAVKQVAWRPRTCGYGGTRPEPEEGTGKVPCSAAGSSRISRIPGATSSPWNPGPTRPCPGFRRSPGKDGPAEGTGKGIPQLDCGACGDPHLPCLCGRRGTGLRKERGVYLPAKETGNRRKRQIGLEK